ncbi:uncharacterized protein K02A2.6-like [Coffea eugenioides]|uniref:uncharacterized protein K02A2.6-like n=1 Tax=Coffea eugenioides TaxID=49369 RepID=UPI000F60D53C|nr:uncharacterized protein K02A2.6-like [Coffea eugenioides]
MLRFVVNAQLITVLAEDDCTMIINPALEEGSDEKALVSPHHMADIVSVGWDEAESCKHVTKKVVTDFLRKYIIYRFGVPETLITDNAKNLNNDMVDGLCEQFKIKYQNFTIYRPQMNGAVEATNKNLKSIIRKMTERHRDWHEKLPYALMAYRTTIRTSTGATLYNLMYGMEAVLPAEVEIPSLLILMEAKLDETDWIKQRHEQLALIDEKRLNAICHGQCYQKRMARAYNKMVKV